jgi:hypothetical protein
MKSNGIYYQNGLSYSNCGTSKERKSDKQDCNTILWAIKGWIKMQKDSFRAGQPSCAGSAMVKHGVDGDLRKAVPTVKNKKKEEAYVPDWAKPGYKRQKPVYKKRSYKARRR